MSFSTLCLTVTKPSGRAEMPLTGVALSPHPHEGLSTYQNAVGVIAYGGRSARCRYQVTAEDVAAKANDIEGDNMWQCKHGWCEGNILWECCTIVASMMSVERKPLEVFALGTIQARVVFLIERTPA